MSDPFKSALYKQIADQLKGDRYALIPASFIGTQGGDLDRSRAEFLKSNQEPMPIDRYNTRGVRRRRLGRFVRIPSSRHLESIPPEWDPNLNEHTVGFFQRREFNPDQGDKQRKFSSLLPDQYLNLFLRTAIEDCATVICRRDSTQPEYINVHIVQVIATPDEPGFSSPPVLHRDGEFFTFAFLLQRHNIIGGENVIGTLSAANKHPNEIPAHEIITRFTLENPWEGYVVDDHGVSHFVDSVVLDETAGCCGWRSVLLIDFTPAVPDIGVE
jgi:hypothetical protein